MNPGGYEVGRFFKSVEGACMWAYPYEYRRRMVLTPITVFDGQMEAVVLDYADGVVVVASTHQSDRVGFGHAYGVLG